MELITFEVENLDQKKRLWRFMLANQDIHLRLSAEDHAALAARREELRRMGRL